MVNTKLSISLIKLLKLMYKKLLISIILLTGCNNLNRWTKYKQDNAIMYQYSIEVNNA